MTQVSHPKAASPQVVTICLVGINFRFNDTKAKTFFYSDSTIDNESRISSRHYHTMDMKRYSLKTVQD